ncbi:sulfatase-like hydrolase/transferase [Candidatus Hydrogenedentota bacterium]
MKANLNRREFLRNTAAMGAASILPFTLGCAHLTPGGRARKPNLLFIWTDEQRFDTMKVYGNDKIKTPNLNTLASESVVFERAYVTQPVCTPSRSSVLTGLWPHQSGCTKNNIPLRQETKCLPELLNDPDYKCAYMGKWHLGDEIFAQHGFDEWVSIEDFYIKHYSEGRDKSKRSDYHYFLVDKGYKPTGNNIFNRGFAARRPIEHCKPKFLEMRACDFMRRNQQNPFILHINFLEPHMPFYGPLDDLHDPEEINFPASFNDPLEENEPLRYRLARERFQKTYGSDEKTLRALYAKYHGLVSQVDRSVGKILENLDVLGLKDDTIVVYTSDHGDMMGAHGMMTKRYMYEESARVPWLMRIPRMKKQVIVKQPVSHIDLVPTLLDLMTGKSLDELPGKSLVPLVKGGEIREDHVFIQWNPDKLQYIKGTKLATEEQLVRLARDTVRAVVSPDGWKLCLSTEDKCQLFDLNNDPLETTDLFDSGKHRDVIERLTDRIREWQASVGDDVKV